ncbi:hypothetical protein [Eleftheria terrae]|uniref:hypothetical protein n=1 Tax=Eleftheria terrae TaxID=1597781 RepID=UPI00263B23B7|nr:hypothetical protein [Eleftheria terrae]WKB51003.1 hypothetical protein N7L95_14415 [Eleftheria terrae]
MSPCLPARRHPGWRRWCGLLCAGALASGAALAGEASVAPAAAALSAPAPAATLDGETLALAQPGMPSDDPAAAPAEVAAAALESVPGPPEAVAAAPIHGPLASPRLTVLGGSGSLLPGMLRGGHWQLAPGFGWQGPLSARALPGQAEPQGWRDGVNLEWSPSPAARWALARGGLRLKFDEHSSLSLRLRRHGIGAYWRARF